MINVKAMTTAEIAMQVDSYKKQMALLTKKGYIVGVAFTEVLPILETELEERKILAG